MGKGLRISIHGEAASLSKYPDLSVFAVSAIRCYFPRPNPTLAHHERLDSVGSPAGHGLGRGLSPGRL